MVANLTAVSRFCSVRQPDLFDRWGTHVERPAAAADAAYLVYTRPGFAAFPGR
jgi:hypothetical protein